MHFAVLILAEDLYIYLATAIYSISKIIVGLIVKTSMKREKAGNDEVQIRPEMFWFGQIFKRITFKYYRLYTNLFQFLWKIIYFFVFENDFIRGIFFGG